MSSEITPEAVAPEELAGPFHARGDISAPPNARSKSGRFVWPAVLLGLGGLFILGYVPRQQQRAALLARADARGHELPSVSWVKPARGKPEHTLTLPGNIQGLEEAVIYARADGYVAHFDADLGDRVSEGQVLAALDTPEYSQELAQAQENLAQANAALVRAEAQRDNVNANLRRYHALAAGVTSREELDQKETSARLSAADVRVAEAARNAQRANLERLKLRQTFATVRAPFAGTITSRTVERGSLVSAGRASPMFKLTSLQTVRVFVQVPQVHVAAVKRGATAQVSVAEYPKHSFAGKVARTADALDASSRTMTVEVHVPNPERKLLPGMYGSVALAIDGSTQSLSVPASALVVGEQGVKVASVAADGTVQLLPVVVERDRGTDIEIASGLTGNEQIIINLPPAALEGSPVHATAAVVGGKGK